MDSILGLLKSLKIRAQDSNSKIKSDLGNDPGLGEVVRQLGDELFREAVLHLHHFCLGVSAREEKTFVKTGFRIRIHFFRIRIQRLRLETNSDPDPVRIQGFNGQKYKKKITAETKIYIYF